MKLGARIPATCIASTITTTAMMNVFASIDFPPRSVVGDSPMMPAEAMGIDTLSLFKDMGVKVYKNN